MAAGRTIVDRARGWRMLEAALAAQEKLTELRLVSGS